MPGGKSAPFLRSALFWGTLIIAASALVILILSKKAAAKKPFAYYAKNGFSFSVLLWSLAWHYAGWGTELWRICRSTDDFYAWFFIVLSGTALLFFVLSKIFAMPLLSAAVFPLQLFALLVMAGPFFEKLSDVFSGYSTTRFSWNYFHGVWLYAWPASFLTGLIMLFFSRKSIPAYLHALWLFSSVLIALPVLTFSLRHVVSAADLAPSWILLAGIAPLLAVLLLLGAAFNLISRSGKYHRIFMGAILPWTLCAVTALWFIVTLFMTGDPSPLPLYLPLLNPIELLEALCIAVIIVVNLKAKKAGLAAMGKAAIVTITDVMIFVWLIAMIVRIVHFFGKVPYYTAAYTDAFRLSLFILMALWGIGHIIAGHRLALRPVWIAGAILTVIDLIKLLLLDLANAGTPVRIVLFFIAGAVLLFIGWAAPLPPSVKRKSLS
jgi:hypothetical protein